MSLRPASPYELAALGFKKLSPEEYAARQADYDAQMKRIPDRIRERYEARLAGGWQPALAFEDALHHGANVGNRREATIQQMTIGASALARDWEHSETFVSLWNAMFPDAGRVSGFACPCVIELGDGRTASVAAEWSLFLAQRKADA